MQCSSRTPIGLFKRHFTCSGRTATMSDATTNSQFVFPPPPISSVAVAGTQARFPVRRIICVGRNYAAHAREMGKDPEREPPFFFTKPADAIVPNNATVAYPLRTTVFHHEVELVVAIGRSGRNVDLSNALGLVFG